MGQISGEQRRQLIEVAPDELSIRRCCNLLGINRSTLYYKENPVEINDVDLLNTIRDTWEQYLFYGYRRITKELRANYKLKVNRKRVQWLIWYGVGYKQFILPPIPVSEINYTQFIRIYCVI